MDLRLGVAGPATDEERDAVASVLGPAETGWEGGERAAADGRVAYGGHALATLPAGLRRPEHRGDRVALLVGRWRRDPEPQIH